MGVREGGGRGWWIKQVRKGGCSVLGFYFIFIFVFVVSVVCRRALSGNPQVIGISMAERGAGDGERVSVPQGSEGEISYAACKSCRAGSQG